MYYELTMESKKQHKGELSSVIGAASVLRPLLKELGLSVVGMEREIGVANATVRSAIMRNRPLSLNLKVRIRERFPQVSKRFLDTAELPVLDPDYRKVIQTPAHTDKRPLSGNYQGFTPNPTEVTELKTMIMELQHTIIKLQERVAELEKRVGG